MIKVVFVKLSGDMKMTLVNATKNTKIYKDAADGGYVKAQFKIDFLKVFTYTTKLDLFSNYIVKAQNVDMNWENLLTIKLSNWFSANLSITLAYDDDIDVPVDRDGDGVYEGLGKRLQFKELLGFGFTYKF